MKTILPLLLAAVLATPVALAGGLNASVDYFESNGSCSSSWYSDGFYHSNSTWDPETGSGWSYSRWSSSQNDRYACSDSFTTASATVSDDSGELAYVGVHGNDASSQSSNSWRQGGSDSQYWNWTNGHGSSWDQSSDSYSSSSGFDRTTEVRAGGQRAAYERGCSYSWSQGSSSSSNSWYFYSNDTWYGSSDSQQHQSRGASESCHETVAAKNANVGRDAGCSSYESEGRYSYSSYESSSSWLDYGCRDVVVANAAGETVAAGRRDHCEAYQYSYGYSSDDEWYTSDYSGQSCADGLVVIDGPDGMRFFLGTQSTSSISCSSTECWSSSYEQIGFSYTWDHNPVGPGQIGVFYPLP